MAMLVGFGQGKREGADGFEGEHGSTNFRALQTLYSSSRVTDADEREGHAVCLKIKKYGPLSKRAASKSFALDRLALSSAS